MHNYLNDKPDLHTLEKEFTDWCILLLKDRFDLKQEATDPHHANNFSFENAAKCIWNYVKCGFEKNQDEFVNGMVTALNYVIDAPWRGYYLEIEEHGEEKSIYAYSEKDVCDTINMIQKDINKRKEQFKV